MWVLERAFAIFVDIIETLIIVRILLSFIIRDFSNPIFNLVYQVTEPILAPFRNLISKLGISTGMFDFSPLLAFMFLNLLSYILEVLVW
ncbi:YggT family protein [Thermohalobacter berrensis]|uniref:YggT family protein n=1 Tax=Thermohalobacter berrensis TaxID=99594 RepID=A0A419TA24_9FIRM|nr:YggT family protein [Thermohalobacter berrensis]RKD34330.1 hypothetical protein BET03_00415 [Thermohalobacter berrensis]